MSVHDEKANERGRIAQRTAVIVVHGVGNPERGATVRTVATKWADARRRSLEERTLRVPIEPLQADRVPKSSVDAPYFAEAHLAPSVLEVAAVQTRAANDADVDFVELHWADLSRTREGALAVGLDLLRMILYLPDMGARILSWNGETRKLGWTRWTAFHTHRLAWGVFANLIPALFALSLVVSGVLAAVAWAPDHADAITTASAIAAGALALIAVWLTGARISFLVPPPPAGWPQALSAFALLALASAAGIAVHALVACCERRTIFALDTAALYAVIALLVGQLVIAPLHAARTRAKSRDTHLDRVYAVAAVAAGLGAVGLGVWDASYGRGCGMLEILDARGTVGCPATATNDAIAIARPILTVLMVLAGGLSILWMAKIGLQSIAALTTVVTTGGLEERRALALAAATLAISSWLFVSLALALTFATFAAGRETLASLVMEPIPVFVPAREQVLLPLSEVVQKTITLSASAQLRNGAVVAGVAVAVLLLAFAPVVLAEWRNQPAMVSRALGRKAAHPGARQRRWLTLAFASLWIPFVILVFDTTVVNMLGMLDSLFASRGQEAPWLEALRLGEPDIALWVTYLGTAFAGTSGLLALRARFESFLPNLGPVVDVALDVERYVRRPTKKGLRPTVLTRMLSLLAWLEAEGYERIVVVAHSQGTVIAADALRLRHTLDPAPRQPMALLTIGSPLARLYGYAFDVPYDWIKRPIALGDMGLASWTNGFVDGDYIGQALGQAGVDDVDLGIGGHTSYWDGEAFHGLLDLIVRGPATSRELPSPP